MRIDCIPIQQLEPFARAALESRSEGAAVPITLQRAKAWVQNPCATESDPALVVAYDNDRCVGYLGLVPSILQTPKGERRINWISTWYVVPAARHSGVGALLLARALGFSRDLVVTWVSRRAGQVFEKVGFRPLGPLRYLVADLNRIDLLSTPWRALRRVLRVSGVPHTPRLDRWVQAGRWPHKKVLYRLARAATAETGSQIVTKQVDRIVGRENKRCPGPTQFCFLRDARVVNWMLRDRWITTDRSRATPGYHFADWQPHFDYLPFEIYGQENGRYRGFAILRISTRHTNRVLTLLDHSNTLSSDESCLVALAMKQADRLMADRIILPAAFRRQVDRLGPVAGLFREETRRYLARPADSESPFTQSPDEIQLQLADGDFAFA